MSENKQGRKWLLTINNPLDAGLDHSRIIEITKKFMPDYFCMADEIAPTTGTPHTHLFIYSKSPIRFLTIKGRFGASPHIDKAYGSAAENRDYVKKEGKWLNDAKAETKVVNSFYEWGELPSEEEEKEPMLFSIISEIKEGKSVAEIVEVNPKYALRTRDLEALRQTILSEIGENQFRNVEVIYLYGESGVGKTRSIFQENDYRDIYRITSYRKNGIIFDGYNSQDVLVFEELHSSVPIGEMLNYLDIYPIRLPARYSDKVAFYTKVYITSNIPLKKQYLDIQHQYPEIWNAFLRRISKIRRINTDGTIDEFTKDGEIL
jgi:hypothetical protein